MRKLARKIVIDAVGTSLFVTSWVCLGLFVLGDRYLNRMSRTERTDTYV